jgi:hypothetical protein
MRGLFYPAGLAMPETFSPFFQTGTAKPDTSLCRHNQDYLHIYANLVLALLQIVDNLRD